MYGLDEVAEAEGNRQDSLEGREEVVVGDHRQTGLREKCGEVDILAEGVLKVERSGRRARLDNLDSPDEEDSHRNQADI